MIWPLGLQEQLEKVTQLLIAQQGQSVLKPVEMHLIPRYKGDVPNPKGGVRGVIPNKQKYSTEEKPQYEKTSRVSGERENRGKKWSKADDERLWTMLYKKWESKRLQMNSGDLNMLYTVG